MAYRKADDSMWQDPWFEQRSPYGKLLFIYFTVSEKYRISSNAFCWQVEERKCERKDGSRRWEFLTFHVSFKNALVALAEYRIRTIADRATVDEIRDAIGEIKAEVVCSVEVFKELGG